MSRRDEAEKLIGGHETSDPPCDTLVGDECNCGYEERVQSIESALLAAEQRALREAADKIEEKNIFEDVPDWLRVRADALTSEGTKT